MKADNEPVISLLVYFKSVKKTKYVLQKKNNNNKRAKIKSSSGKSRTPDLQRGRSVRIFVKLIVFNTFAHEVQPVDAVRSRRRALFMKN